MWGLVAARWGLRTPALRLLYLGAVVPPASYAGSVWAHRLTLSVGLTAALNRTQRPTLISTIGPYRTTPTLALQVLVRSLPLDLEVRRRSDLYDRGRLLAEHLLYRSLGDIDSSLSHRVAREMELGCHISIYYQCPVGARTKMVLSNPLCCAASHWSRCLRGLLVPNPG